MPSQSWPQQLELDSELAARMLAQALEQFYDVAREEYADGSGEASPEQNAVADLLDKVIALLPDVQAEQERQIEAMQDGIAASLGAAGATGIRFGSDSGFDWDEHGNAIR